MEGNIREAMTAAHDNMQEKMQEKVAEVKNTLDSLEGNEPGKPVHGNRVYGLQCCFAGMLSCGGNQGQPDRRVFRNLCSPFHPAACSNLDCI